MIDINELENLRKDAVRRVILGIIIGIVFIVGLYTIYGKFIHPVVIVLVFVFVKIFSSKKIKIFSNKYKEVIVLEIFKSIFTDITYELDRGISESIIASTKMMRMGNRFYSNDYMKAKYKNVSFEFSDVLIQNETRDSDGDRHVETLFEGQWYVFDFNKRFKADVQVCEKGFSNAKRGSFFSSDIFNKIELEDIEFNKMFNVYAQNDLDAFYILTPNTMEKVKEINNKIHGKILLCFIDNKLHVGLHNRKDLFEPKLFKKIDIEKNHKEVRDDVLLITQFVDILDLDNTLFRGEV